jgi:hypothetical protein
VQLRRERGRHRDLVGSGRQATGAQPYDAVHERISDVELHDDRQRHAPAWSDERAIVEAGPAQHLRTGRQRGPDVGRHRRLLAGCDLRGERAVAAEALLADRSVVHPFRDEVSAPELAASRLRPRDLAGAHRHIGCGQREHRQPDHRDHENAATPCPPGVPAGDAQRGQQPRPHHRSPASSCSG